MDTDKSLAEQLLFIDPETYGNCDYVEDVKSLIKQLLKKFPEDPKAIAIIEYLKQGKITVRHCNYVVKLAKSKCDYTLIKILRSCYVNLP